MSYVFKVGDKVQRKAQYRGVMDWPHGANVVIVTGVKDGHLVFDDTHRGGWQEDRFDLIQSFSEQGKARANDPDTSKKAAKVKRTGLKELMYAAFTIQIINTPDEYVAHGFTGHELASYMGKPLNSITPRFAEMRRDGGIEDSGMRRDGQIVWVLTEPSS